jgi:hypothetical protein
MVRVNADVQDGDLVISVTDNGHGFDVEEAAGQGMGLQGMQERARLVGGTLVVMSEPSGGTTIELRAPLPAAPLTAAVPAPLPARDEEPEGSPFGASLEASEPDPDERVELEPGPLPASAPMRLQ